MAKKSILLVGALCLFLVMSGLAIAGTHADCIKNCIDTRTSAGEDCKRGMESALKQCDTLEAACITSAKDDAEKKACRKANRECKATAQDNYSKCIKKADEDVKKCKDACPPDKKPNISTESAPGQMGTGQPSTDKTLNAIPAQPGKTGEPAGRKVKTGNIHLVCPKGTEKYCDGNKCSCWTIKD